MYFHFHFKNDLYFHFFPDSNGMSSVGEKVSVEYLKSEDSFCQIGIYIDVDRERRKLVGSVGKTLKTNLDSKFCQDNLLSAEQVRIQTNKIRLSTQMTR